MTLDELAKWDKKTKELNNNIKKLQNEISNLKIENSNHKNENANFKFDLDEKTSMENKNKIVIEGFRGKMQSFTKYFRSYIPRSGKH